MPTPTAPTYDALVKRMAPLGRALAKKKLTVAVAESCTGGLLGAVARAGHSGDDVLRRGMLYGSVLGSLAVEDFSVRRIVQADTREIEGRLSTLVDMISLNGARAQ